MEAGFAPCFGLLVLRLGQLIEGFGTGRVDIVGWFDIVGSVEAPQGGTMKKQAQHCAG